MRPAAKIIFTRGTFLNEVRMRKLRSSEGVHPMGWPLDVDGESTTCSGRRRVATNARRTREATSSRVTVPRVLPQIFWSSARADPVRPQEARVEGE